MIRLAVVAQPGDRRTGLLLAAAAAAGLPPVTVVPWRAVATGAPIDLAGATAIRIESPGEDPELAGLLRGDTTPIGHGEIAGLARWYSGLIAAARRVEAAVPAGARLLNPVGDLAVLFDKRRCHAVLTAAGVPGPPALPAVTGWDELRARMADAGWRRVFVKPAHGSSASGVLALVADGARTSAVTSVERAPDGRLYNAMPVRRYTGEGPIAAIVDRLGPDGLHVERWFPKASHAGRTLDLRVVVIDGRAAHVVVRTSRSPLTNLHLGNARGDLAAVRAAAGETNWAAAMRTCERAAAQFPGTLHVGVDLMFAPGWDRHAVAEVNAFGDLLPGVLVDGRDTYAAELAAILNRSGAPASAAVEPGEGR